jgi:hypothetical protein
MEVILSFEVLHFKTLNGCNHNQMSQRRQRTQGLECFFFWVIFIFLYTGFCGWNILQHVTKNTYNSSIHHIFCINFWWVVIKNFQKVHIFYQILRLILKNYPNFRLYKNMLIILWFVFLYHKIQLCFRCHVHYTLFICRKGLLKIFNCVQ